MTNFKVLTTIILALLLTACSNTSNNEQDVQQAQFIDSAVSGVSYFTPTQSGTTDENGFFEYLEGETITFVFGEYQVSIPSSKVSNSLTSKKYITPYDFFVKDDNEAIRFALFLQTLDNDNDSSNGIQLGDSINLAKDVDFSTDDGVLQALVQAAPQKSIVSFAQAKEHMRQSIERIEDKETTSTTKEVVSRFAPPSFPTN